MLFSLHLRESNRMTRLLLVIFYSFRYIYWALIEFSTAFGKKLRVQGNVESTTSEPVAMGLDQICIRYKYKVNGRTYSGSLIRECSRSKTSWKLLRRFPVGGAVWVRVDPGRPHRSHLSSGLGYAGPVLALIPASLLLVAWFWWVHFRLVMLHHNTQPLPGPQIEVANCPAGLPGTPDAAAGTHNRNARKGLITFKSQEGEFSILLPLPPQHEQMENLPSPYGPIKFLRSTAETPDALYEVSYGDVPGIGPIEESWLASTGNGRLRQSTLIERHDIKLNGTPGSAYTAADDHYYWSERIYFVGRRYYRITVYFPRSGCNWPSQAAEILNSFRTTHPRR